MNIAKTEFTSGSLAALPTYHDQEPVRAAEEWRAFALQAYMLRFVTPTAIAMSLQNAFEQKAARLRQAYEIDTERTTRVIGERLTSVLLSSPYGDQIERVTGRGKSMPSLLAKELRREAQGSKKRFSDVHGYAIDVSDGVDTWELLEYARREFEVAPCDEYGDPAIDVMGNGTSAPGFRELGILVGKFHMPLGGQERYFEVVARTTAQRLGYEDSRSMYDNMRPKDTALVCALGDTALNGLRPMTFYAGRDAPS